MKSICLILFLLNSPFAFSNPFDECKLIIERDFPYLLASDPDEACVLINEREEQIDSEGETHDEDDERLQQIRQEFKERTGLKEIDENNWDKFREFSKIRGIDPPVEYNFYWLLRIRVHYPEKSSKEKALDRVCYELGEAGIDLLSGRGTTINDCEELYIKKQEDCPTFYTNYLMNLKKFGSDGKNIIMKDFLEIFPNANNKLKFEEICSKKAIEEITKLHRKDIIKKEVNIKKESIQTENKKNLPEQKQIGVFSNLSKYGPILGVLIYLFPEISKIFFITTSPLLNWILNILFLGLLSIFLFLFYKKRNR